MATDTDTETGVFSPANMDRYTQMLAPIAPKLIAWPARFSMPPGAAFPEGPEYVLHGISSSDLCSLVAWLGYLDGALMASGQPAVALVAPDSKDYAADIPLLVEMLIEEVVTRVGTPDE